MLCFVSLSSADEGEEDEDVEGDDGVEENETPAKKVITGDNINIRRLREDF